MELKGRLNLPAKNLLDNLFFPVGSKSAIPLVFHLITLVVVSWAHIARSVFMCVCKPPFALPADTSLPAFRPRRNLMRLRLIKKNEQFKVTNVKGD